MMCSHYLTIFHRYEGRWLMRTQMLDPSFHLCTFTSLSLNMLVPLYIMFYIVTSTQLPANHTLHYDCTGGDRRIKMAVCFFWRFTFWKIGSFSHRVSVPPSTFRSAGEVPSGLRPAVRNHTHAEASRRWGIRIRMWLCPISKGLDLKLYSCAFFCASLHSLIVWKKLHRPYHPFR